MDIDGVSWRRSSYSGSGGGNCVEVGVWRKASYSTSSGGNCVEVGLWHKASYSSSNGGNCIEVGLSRTASYSGSNGGGCVEVTRNPDKVVAVRDSKDPDGPRLTFTPDDWRDFIGQVKTGQLVLA